jgi:dimethylargininase
MLDPERARRQHAAFVTALEAAGAQIERLPPEPDLPDATFVSDTLLAFPLEGPTRLLVITRPGAPSRRAEVAAVAARARALAPGARVVELREPGTLDGGDVICFADRVAIGLSTRTNREGANQLAEAIRPLGYRAFLCPVQSRLHLATAVTPLGGNRMIGTPAGFESLDAAGASDGVERLVLLPDEQPAANVLALGSHCLMVSGHPRAADLLRRAGHTVTELELDEFVRADGGPTCLVALVP